MRHRWIGLTIASIAAAVLAMASPRPATAASDIEIVRDYRSGLAHGDLIRIGGPTAERLRAAPPENLAVAVALLGLFDPVYARLLMHADLTSLTPDQARDAAADAAVDHVGIDPGAARALLDAFAGYRIARRLQQTSGDIYVLLGRYPAPGDGSARYSGRVTVANDLDGLDSLSMLHVTSLDEAVRNPCGCSIGATQKSDPRPNCWREWTMTGGTKAAYNGCPERCDRSAVNPVFGRTTWRCPAAEPPGPRLVDFLTEAIQGPDTGTRRVVLLIDTSESMRRSDPDNLRAAAVRQIADLAAAGSAVAVAGFASEAALLAPMTRLGDGAGRNGLRAAADRITASGGTSIDAALALAATVLAPTRQGDTVVLMSDGHAKGDWSAAPDAVPPEVTVHAVAFGAKADRAALARLAERTGGTLELANSPAELEAALLRQFRSAEGKESVLSVSDGVIRQGERQARTFTVEPGATEMQASLQWPGSDLDLILVSPDGEQLTPRRAGAGRSGVAGARLEALTIAGPKPGTWRLLVDAVETPAGGSRYRLDGSVGGSPIRVAWSQIAPTAGGPVDLVLTGVPVRWTAAHAVAADQSGGARFEGPLAFDARNRPLLPAGLAGDLDLTVSLEGVAPSGAAVARSFRRLVQVQAPAAPDAASPPPARPPAPAAADGSPQPPAFLDPNALVRALAPGYTESFRPDAPPSVELDIRFETDSATLSDVSTAQLEALGTALTSRQLEGARFRIAGHTDARGTDAYNQALSERRAEAVAAYLVRRFGMTAAHLETAGHGETRLRDPDRPDSSVNRRVEVTLIEAPRRADGETPGQAPSPGTGTQGGGTIRW